MLQNKRAVSTLPSVAQVTDTGLHPHSPAEASGRFAEGPWPPCVQAETSPAERPSGPAFANARPGTSVNRNDDKAKTLKAILE